MKPTVKWAAVGALATALAAGVAIFQAINKTPELLIAGNSNVGIGSISGGSQVNIGASELKQHESRAIADKAKVQFEALEVALSSLKASKYCTAATGQLAKARSDAQQALSEGRNIAAAELYGSAAGDAQRISSILSIYDAIRERVNKRIERERQEIAKGHRRHLVDGKDARVRLALAEKLAANGDFISAFETIDPETAKFSKNTLDQTAKMSAGCVTFHEYVKASSEN